MLLNEQIMHVINAGIDFIVVMSINSCSWKSDNVIELYDVLIGESQCCTYCRTVL